MRPNKNLICLITHLYCIFCVAQMSNRGMMYVNENTVVSTFEDFNNFESATFINDGNTLFYGNYSNNGIVDFYGSNGLIHFAGQSPQLINGEAASNFNHVRFFNNSDGTPFYVANDLNIFGVADFSDGILDNDSYGGEIFFMENGSHINTSDQSFVDGPVLKVRTENFRYPTGDISFYRYAEVSGNPAEEIVRVKYFLENSNVLFDHSLRQSEILFINPNEYWEVTASNNGEGFFLTLPWSSSTTPEEIINAASNGDISIVRWDSNENSWVNEGGIVDRNTNTISTQVSDSGVFTMGRLINTDTELPCGLSVFNALSTNGDGKNDYFLIEGLSNQTCVDRVHLSIFNRWGIKVYESDNYGENGDVFRGFSDGRLTFQKGNKLPSGTYYYHLELEYFTANNERELFKKVDYLYLNDGN